MYPSQFEYAAPTSLGEALDLLRQHGEDAKLLAGGHSLLPLMKLRLAAPAVLIDLGLLPELGEVRTQNGAIEIGALTTYASVLASTELSRTCPLLSQTAEHVGDVQVRNRGTMGGAAAHADPAGDMPAALLALDASFALSSPGGERVVSAGDFFIGPFTTVLEPDEVLTRISIPATRPRTGSAYEKARNPASGYAIVGVAAIISLDDRGTIVEARVAITGVGAQPARAGAVEDALRGSVPGASVIASAAERAVDDLEVLGDMHGSVQYRSHLARVYTRRALTRTLESAGHA